MKIVTILGARPQFIKAAMLHNQFRKYSDIEEVVVHTGQHYDKNMSEVFFFELNIAKPHYNLGIGGGSHGQNTGRMIEAIEAVLISEKPNSVIVYGDTDSTLAGALAAVKINIPIIHIEAGLRSFNRQMPEEINRVLVDHVSNLLFTPTKIASQNLLQEGIKENVFLVGDIMYDAAIHYSGLAEEKSLILKKLDISSKCYILATIHRKENTDSLEKLENIITSLNNLPLPVILPLHPRTKLRLQTYDLVLGDNLKVIEPLGYLDMVMLEKNAAVIVTDSGGVQKEAYFHGVPSMIVRQETEWIELIDNKAGVLVDARDKLSFENAMQELMGFEIENVPENIYGDGNTSSNISQLITSLINTKQSGV